jgi:hypothetical protein
MRKCALQHIHLETVESDNRGQNVLVVAVLLFLSKPKAKKIKEIDTSPPVVLQQQATSFVHFEFPSSVKRRTPLHAHQQIREDQLTAVIHASNSFPHPNARGRR